MVLGIDFGSKVAGTTVICYKHENQLIFESSVKSKSADLFLAEAFEKLKATKVFIDAPLSLPAAFYGRGENFHFRDCDIKTQAMSPMFLGGLTARAIKLKSSFEKIEFFETYPAFLMKIICPNLKDIYTKKLKLSQHSIDWLSAQVEWDFVNIPANWHEFDAALAWLSGARFNKNEALQIGDASEGLIWV